MILKHYAVLSSFLAFTLAAAPQAIAAGVCRVKSIDIGGTIDTPSLPELARALSAKGYLLNADLQPTYKIGDRFAGLNTSYVDSQITGGYHLGIGETISWQDPQISSADYASLSHSERARLDHEVATLPVAISVGSNAERYFDNLCWNSPHGAPNTIDWGCPKFTLEPKYISLGEAPKNRARHSAASEVIARAVATLVSCDQIEAQFNRANESRSGARARLSAELQSVANPSSFCQPKHLSGFASMARSYGVQLGEVFQPSEPEPRRS